MIFSYFSQFVILPLEKSEKFVLIKAWKFYQSKILIQNQAGISSYFFAFGEIR